MRAAAVQLSSQADLSSNLARAGELVRAAASEGAEFICLPEGFAYLGPEEGRRALAEPLDSGGPILAALASFAKELGVFVLGGGMPERSADPLRPYNTSVLIAPDGALVASYRKVHLFDVELDDGTSLRESSASLPGDHPVVADLGALRVGLSVCYDLRFARLFELERAAGADVLTVPAAFTQTTGRAHWHVLLRARAIETQCWVVAPAQCGSHPRGRRTFGHSLIVDPWGTVVAELPEGEGFITASLELEAVARARRQIPVALHRRL